MIVTFLKRIVVMKMLMLSFCGPFIVALQALVNLDFMDSNKNFVSEIISNLLGIFHAIQNAEDAADARITPKLHIISKIGLITVKALSQHCKISSGAPCQVLLPSSYYRKSCRVASCHSDQFIDEDFVRRILYTVESSIAQPVNPDSKQHRQEDARLVDVKKCISNDIPWEKKFDSLPSKIKHKENVCAIGKGLQKIVPQKIYSKERQMNLLSATSLVSTKLLHENSIIYESTNLSPEFANTTMDQLSSCDSASTKPLFPDSHILSSEAEFRNCFPLVTKQRNDTNMRISTEPTNPSKKNLKCHTNSMEIGNPGETLDGCRIRVWSPIDMRYNSGTVDSYDSQNNNYKITYDKGDVELVHLEDKRWEAIDDATLLKKDTCSFQPRDLSCSSTSSLEVLTGVIGDGTNEARSTSLDERVGNSKRLFSFSTDNAPFSLFVVGIGKRKRPVPAVAAKKRAVSNVVDESICVAQRTRRAFMQ